MSERTSGRAQARRAGEAFRRFGKSGAAGTIVALGLAIGAAAQAQVAGHSPYFLDGGPWTQDVSNAPVDAQSAAIISQLVSQNIWTNPLHAPPERIQIDWGLEVLEGDGATFRTFDQTTNWGDCEETPVPLPAGGALEGENGYQCTGGGDCHLLVVHRATNRLFESWSTTVDGSNVIHGACMAVWDLRNSYQPYGRGDGCSSADAAGYPIAPLLVNADEVAANAINHALRFVLPNSAIRDAVFVHPASHSTRSEDGGASGGPNTPPYGAHFRLKSTFDVNSLPTVGARRIAVALQKYGMYLSDGGSIALTLQSDRFTVSKWDDPAILDGDSHALSSILVTDFEMVEAGPRFDLADCERVFPLFGDGFEAGVNELTPKWSAKK